MILSTHRTLAAALGLGVLLATAPTAQTTLGWSGAQLGATVEYQLAGDAGEFYALKPSLILAPTPLPGGTLDIGLDLVNLTVIGQLSFATGTAQQTFVLPNDVMFSGVPIHAQFLTFPGPGVLVDDVSNRTTFVAGFPGSIHPTFGEQVRSRVGHSATELGDGRVLLAGGAENTVLGTVVTASMEVYDPDVQEFSELAGTLTTARSAHTATRLLDGRVLLVGGIDGTNTPLATAELFDPITNTITQTSSMAVARTQHTATRLNDGRVFVTGGTSNFDTTDILSLASSTLQSSEIYDPGTNSWSAAASLPIGGQYGAVGQGASLNGMGQVLVTGGIVVNTGVFGVPLPTVSNGAWRYNPGSDQWLPTPSMATARVYHAQRTLPTGEILIAGGGTLDFFSLAVTTFSSCELYGPTNTWSSAPSLAYPRAYATLVDAGGEIVAVGGLSTVDITTTTGTPALITENAPYSVTGWTDGPALLAARELVAAAAIDSGDRILVTGADNTAMSPDKSADQIVR